MTNAILTLIVVSALAEIFGTLTVWVNYFRGAQLSALVKSDIAKELAVQVQQNPLTEIIVGMDWKNAAFESRDTDAKLRQLRAQVAELLSRRWFLTTGLAAYVCGALTGLLAGILALRR